MYLSVGGSLGGNYIIYLSVGGSLGVNYIMYLSVGGSLGDNYIIETHDTSLQHIVSLQLTYIIQ